MLIQKPAFISMCVGLSERVNRYHVIKNRFLTLLVNYKHSTILLLYLGYCELWLVQLFYSPLLRVFQHLVLLLGSNLYLAFFSISIYFLCATFGE